MVREKDIPKGYKKTEAGVIPEEWEVAFINDSFTIKGRIGWQGLTTKEYLSDGEYYLVTGTDFENGKIKWDTCNFISAKRYNQDRNIQLKLGDILITKDGTIGKVAFVDCLPKDATLNSGIFVIRPKNKNSDALFFNYVMNSIIFSNFLKKLAAGSTISHLYQKDFVNFYFPLPPLEEQKAIAEVLSDIDELITSIEKLIDKKQKIKQGTMQLLLTGKKRLPGFTGEWEVKRLGEIADVRKGQLITEESAFSGNVPVIGGGKQPSYYHNKSNRIGKTITISASGAYAGYVSFYDIPIFASDCSTIGRSDTYSVEYIYYYLHSKQKQIYNMQTGGAQPHVYPRDVQLIPIPLPPLEEQKAIAQILSDMDSEIEALQQELEKYKLIKEGMMEQLLTGKVRLV